MKKRLLVIFLCGLLSVSNVVGCAATGDDENVENTKKKDKDKNKDKKEESSDENDDETNADDESIDSAEVESETEFIPGPDLDASKIIIGDNVEFGAYNGETLNWRVLDVDIVNGKALLVSNEIIDSIEVPNEGYVDIWEDSYERSYLNDTFINQIFTEEQQSIISLSDVGNSSYYAFQHGWTTEGYMEDDYSFTQDKLFLLSWEEYLNYCSPVRDDVRDYLNLKVELNSGLISQDEFDEEVKLLSERFDIFSPYCNSDEEFNRIYTEMEELGEADISPEEYNERMEELLLEEEALSQRDEDEAASTGWSLRSDDTFAKRGTVVYDYEPVPYKDYYYDFYGDYVGDNLEIKLRPAMWVNVDPDEIPCEALDASNISIGDTVTFGQYEWDVLDIDYEGGKALIITHGVLLGETAFDSRNPANDYNNNYAGQWGCSDVRDHLNTNFINGFEPKERVCIIPVTIENVRNSDFWEKYFPDRLEQYGSEIKDIKYEDTVDKVFLLSIEEVEKYYGLKAKKEADLSYSDDGCNSEAARAKTDYKLYDEDYVYASYWLRSQGWSYDSVAYVDADGFINQVVVGRAEFGGGYTKTKLGRRPAMWVMIK